MKTRKIPMCVRHTVRIFKHSRNSVQCDTVHKQTNGRNTVGVSVSITADAVNNLSDASSSIISLLGFRPASRPADEEHPYGHGRYEYLSGLMVAVLVTGNRR